MNNNYTCGFLKQNLTFDMSKQGLINPLSTYVELLRMDAGLSSVRHRLAHNSANTAQCAEKLIDFLSCRGYVTSSSYGSNYFSLLKDAQREVHVSAIVTSSDATSMSMTFEGDEDEYLIVKAFFEEQFSSKGALVSTITSIDENDRVQKTDAHVEQTPENKAHQVFYPFMKSKLEEYFAAFMAAKENVLVLYGPPGTGKSTFLRSLIVTGNHRAYLAYDSEVVKSPHLISAFYKNSKANILALEDVDVYMANRTQGNTAMSAYLNATEGVVPRYDKKIIFSTNLASIDKIDPALLRRGRCFDVIKFELLSVPEARAVEAEMGMAEQDLSSKAAWSLSEILNPVSSMLQCSSRAPRSAGF